MPLPSQPMLPTPHQGAEPPNQPPAPPEILGRKMPASLDELLATMVGNLKARFVWMPLVHPDPTQNGMLAHGTMRELYMTSGPAVFSRVTYEVARQLDQNNIVWCIPAFYAIRQECLAAGGSISSLCMLYSVVSRENKLPPSLGADAISAEVAARELLRAAGHDPGEGPITERMSAADSPEYLGERMSDLFIWRNGGYRHLVGDGKSLTQRFFKLAEEHLIHVERSPSGQVVKAWPREEVVGFLMEVIMMEQNEDDGDGEDDGEDDADE